MRNWKKMMSALCMTALLFTLCSCSASHESTETTKVSGTKQTAEQANAQSGKTLKDYEFDISPELYFFTEDRVVIKAGSPFKPIWLLATTQGQVLAEIEYDNIQHAGEGVFLVNSDRYDAPSGAAYDKNGRELVRYEETGERGYYQFIYNANNPSGNFTILRRIYDEDYNDISVTSTFYDAAGNVICTADGYAGSAFTKEGFALLAETREKENDSEYCVIDRTGIPLTLTCAGNTPYANKQLTDIIVDFTDTRIVQIKSATFLDGTAWDEDALRFGCIDMENRLLYITDVPFYECNENYMNRRGQLYDRYGQNLIIDLDEVTGNFAKSGSFNLIDDSSDTILFNYSPLNKIEGVYSYTTFINSQGELLCDPIANISPYNNDIVGFANAKYSKGLILVQTITTEGKYDKLGYINTAGSFVVPPVYEREKALPSHDGYAIADYALVYDMNGKVVFNLNDWK